MNKVLADVVRNLAENYTDKNNNLSDLTDAAAARNNLGITSTPSGIYTDMTALSPSEGDEFYMTDYLRGLWRYRWGVWTYTEVPFFYQHWGMTAAGGTPFAWMRSVVSGAGAAATVTLDTGNVTKHGAYMVLSTGSTTTGGSQVDGFFGSNGGARKMIVAYRFQIPTLASAIEDFYVPLGIDHGVTSGAALVYNRSANTGNSHNWVAIVGSNINLATLGTTVGTKTDTGLAADTSWHTAAIVYAGTSVEFYMDGVSMCTPISTNLPGNSDRLFRGASIKKTAGTTSRTLNIDEVKGYL